MEHIEKIKDDIVIKINFDELPYNPRNNEPLGTMVCFHRRYDLGDKHYYCYEDFNGWDELEKAIIESENVHTILPLYLYDHSGITISTSPFSCNWDSGQIGWIFVSKDRVIKEHIDETKVEEYLKAEVKEYDSYIRGEVYCYDIYKLETCNLNHVHEDLIDSCTGYYDFQSCLDDAKNVVNSL